MAVDCAVEYDGLHNANGNKQLTSFGLTRCSHDLSRGRGNEGRLRHKILHTQLTYSPIHQIHTPCGSVPDLVKCIQIT